MDSDVADAMNWMLQRVVSGGTGIAAKLDDRAVAGKTGTSEGARDLWFIGSVPQLTTAVWFGYDDNRETKSGSGEAAWAWKQFMLQLVDELPPRPFPPKPKLKRPFQPPSKEAKRDSKLPFKGFEYAPGAFYPARRSPRSQPILGTGCCGRSRMLQLRRHGHSASARSAAPDRSRGHGRCRCTPKLAAATALTKQGFRRSEAPPRRNHPLLRRHQANAGAAPPASTADDVARTA